MTSDDRVASARRQPRSDVTRAAFLDAAERLFGEQGIEHTSVTDVAAEAHRSIGSLYHHFADKAALVAAVVDRINDDLDAEITVAVDPVAWTGRSITDIVVGYVTGSLATERARPGYKRIINEVSLLDVDARGRSRALRARLYGGLTRLILARRDEIGHPDPETAVRFVVDQITSMLSTRLDPTITPTELENRTDDQFLEACVESASSYLRLVDAHAGA